LGEDEAVQFPACVHELSESRLLGFDALDRTVVGIERDGQLTIDLDLILSRCVRRACDEDPNEASAFSALNPFAMLRSTNCRSSSDYR